MLFFGIGMKTDLFRTGGCDGAHSVGGCDGAQSTAERSYPMSEVRAEAGRTPRPRGSGQEELPTFEVRGSG